ncbi:putative ribonuclease H-like domain-containing protein [Tanacetum coccineum]
MSVPVTAEEKTTKKNDVKARSLLLIALPNEHQLTFIWMNKAKIKTMSINDLYNNFKIVEQSVKKSIGASSDAQNLAFMTAPSTSKQIHEDDLEAMDLKWQLSLLSMRAKRYFQRTRKKNFINANDTTGNQDNTRKQGNNEDTSSKEMLAIDGVGLDWSDMAEEQVQTNMALMAFSDSENEVLFSEEVAVLKREVACKDYEINVLKTSKDLDKLLGSQITDKSKKGLGYNVVPPPYPLIYNRPKKLDLSYSGLDEFKDPEFKSYGSEDSKQESNIVCDKKSDASKENSDDSLVKEQVLEDTSSFVESPLNVDKETIFLDKKIEIVKPKNHEKPVKKSVRNMTPRAVLLKTGLTPLNTVRPVNTAHPKPVVHSAKSIYVNTAMRHYHTERPRAGNTARSYTKPVNVVRAKRVHAVKTSSYWVWRPTKSNGQATNGFIDSGCSRHMTGNIAYLSDFKEFDGGYVTFGGGAHGGRISCKGTLKTDSLDFEDVYFVNELKFNLFSVSHMCDKKNYVLFTDTECLVLSPNFKLPDETQILLNILRKDNMRLGHINFKNINKLVKDNLVRGLPTKRFENDQICVACLKGKQHRASCKSKVLNPITKPLFMLHMDLFGPTFVSSLMHKKYCLVVTDDYSRFTWVFFLATKDETSEILKNFIKEIENLVDKKVKIIRCDNGTEFKNKVMDDFCREKGIRREYSVARTPQHNGVTKRRNRTLIEAARTMLADSKLPTTFWAKAVSTACYVQNRVLVVKPHNKTPYELFRGLKPALNFMRPFGCHVTILNTLDNLGKFNGKSDEGFFVGYSLSNKAFRVYNTRTRRVEENLHIGFLENKSMIEGNGLKWLFDIDSLTQSINYVRVAADASYFDSPSKDVGNGEPKFVAGDQKQVEDGPNNENDDKDKSEDDSSLKEVNTTGQHVNTASPKVNTGRFKLNIVDPSVNIASSYDPHM